MLLTFNEQKSREKLLIQDTIQANKKNERKREKSNQKGRHK